MNRDIRLIPEIIRQQGYVLNSYCQMPGTFAAEVYAGQGWDAVMLDMQHGLIGYESAVAIFQSICSTGVAPLVRVAADDPGLVMKMLDAGAAGIVCAMINTGEDAKRLVECCRYPPVGARSLGPARASAVYGEEYVQKVAQDIMVLAMVETEQAVGNVDDILCVEGIDGIYIGPGDLAVSMGCRPDLLNPDPKVSRAVKKVLGACKAHGAIVGMIAPDAEHAWRLVQQGFTFVTLASDLTAIRQQARNWVDGFRSLAEPGRRA